MKTALERAEHPERIFIGVVQQNARDDPECLRTEKTCAQDPMQTLCKYSSQIRIKKKPADEAKGPVPAPFVWNFIHSNPLYFYLINVLGKKNFLRFYVSVDFLWLVCRIFKGAIARASAWIFSCAIAQSVARLISCCFLYFARAIARASARKYCAIVPLLLFHWHGGI